MEFGLLSHAVKQVKIINERKRQTDFFEYQKDNGAIESTLVFQLSVQGETSFNTTELQRDRLGSLCSLLKQ
jgi:hypothetical protein